MWIYRLVLGALGVLAVAAFPRDQLAGKEEAEVDLRISRKGESARTFGNKTETSVNASQPLDGVFWTRRATEGVEQVFAASTHALRERLGGLRVVGVEEGCGNMQNRLLIYEDGTRACARYRTNTDQIQGEVYSYFLSRLLGIPGVPPALLARADPGSDPRWSLVEAQLQAARWRPDHLLVITPYIDNLQPTYIPEEIRGSGRSLSPGTLPTSRTPTPELVQWSDLILLDYMTGNVDRLVNNLFNLQWNPDMMSAPAHNLLRAPGGGLVFLDNESGLLHSYRILPNYTGYHESLLRALCVFRREAVTAIRQLRGSAGTRLAELLTEEEPRAGDLPRLPAKHVTMLEERMGRVLRQVEGCREMYRG